MNWIKQTWAIFKNALKLILNDPFSLILHLSLLLLFLLLSAIPGFTYGEHMKLLRDQCHSLLFLMGCLIVTFSMIRILTV